MAGPSLALSTAWSFRKPLESCGWTAALRRVGSQCALLNMASVLMSVRLALIAKAVIEA
jgi:hypothetical protein